MSYKSESDSDLEYKPQEVIDLTGYSDSESDEGDKNTILGTNRGSNSTAQTVAKKNKYIYISSDSESDEGDKNPIMGTNRGSNSTAQTGADNNNCIYTNSDSKEDKNTAAPARKNPNELPDLPKNLYTIKAGDVVVFWDPNCVRGQPGKLLSWTVAEVKSKEEAEKSGTYALRMTDNTPRGLGDTVALPVVREENKYRSLAPVGNYILVPSKIEKNDNGMSEHIKNTENAMLAHTSDYINTVRGTISKKKRQAQTRQIKNSSQGK
jgi:hypothetical protein